MFFDPINSYLPYLTLLIVTYAYKCFAYLEKLSVTFLENMPQMVIFYSSLHESFSPLYSTEVLNTLESGILLLLFFKCSDEIMFQIFWELGVRILDVIRVYFYANKHPIYLNTQKEKDFQRINRKTFSKREKQILKPSFLVRRVLELLRISEFVCVSPSYGKRNEINSSMIKILLSKNF